MRFFKVLSNDTSTSICAEKPKDAAKKFVDSQKPEELPPAIIVHDEIDNKKFVFSTEELKNS